MSVIEGKIMNTKLIPAAYMVTGWVQHEVDAYEEYFVPVTKEEFDKLPEKDELIENGHAVPLYALPDTHKLVPVEPTETMLEAYRKVMDNTYNRNNEHYRAIHLHKNMLKAI